MASACINTIGMSPGSFLDSPATFSSYGWFSPRMSSCRDDDASKSAGVNSTPSSPSKELADVPLKSKHEVSGDDIGDFEFRLEDPVMMLPADELFSDGKLMPLQLSMSRPAETSSGIKSPESPKAHRISDISGMDPYLFSPKAPRCSSRWKDLLGLKKRYQNATRQDTPKTTSSLNPNTSTSSAKSIKQFLQRNSKSSMDSSMSLALLKDTENELISISSRLSLSSSSSGHDHDDLPRLSLDSEKQPNSNLTQRNTNPPRIRLVKHRSAVSSESRIGRSQMRRPAAENSSTAGTTRGLSVDSPRMNSSGKIVFHSLERSSSSPSSFNGGPRYKHRGIERSYSASVRVTPVLNVPVCSLRGSSKSGGVFGFPLFSGPSHKRETSNSSNGGGGNAPSHKREGSNGGGNGNGSRSHRHSHQQGSSKIRTERA